MIDDALAAMPTGRTLAQEVRGRVRREIARLRMEVFRWVPRVLYTAPAERIRVALTHPQSLITRHRVAAVSTKRRLREPRPSRRRRGDRRTGAAHAGR